MLLSTRNNRTILLGKYQAGDLHRLHSYLNKLGESTRKRFGPHAFDPDAIREFYHSVGQTGYIATDYETGAIIAYAIIKNGMLLHDIPRLEQYGLIPDSEGDCSFAPSVADDWQGCGVGDALFRYILADISSLGRKRIILWGGVQADNTKAVHYYHKNGFNTLGKFEYGGLNFDMVRSIECHQP